MYVCESIDEASSSSSSGTSGSGSGSGSSDRRLIPIVVVPHGGPHSVTPTSFIASSAFLSLNLGAAILSINYRCVCIYMCMCVDCIHPHHQTIISYST